MAAIGAVVLLGEKIPGFKLGRLPGDIVITSDRSDIERLLESRSVTAVFTNV